MDGIEQLQTEHEQLRTRIESLTAPVALTFPARVEDVWRRLRLTSAVLREGLLPHLGAVDDLIGRALGGIDTEDDTILAVRVLADDILRELDELDELDLLLLEHGLTAPEVLNAMRIVGGVRALAMVTLRVLDEVVLPRLEREVTVYELGSIADAVMAYEQVLADAS